MSAVASRAISTSLIQRIGATPLLLVKLASRPGVAVYGKAEFFNPGGSVKDRAALRMILQGEADGLLYPGKTLLDSTSGNTGIAYAMICAARGYPVQLFLPENASAERRQMLGAYGAQLVLTPAAEGSDGAQRRCRELYARQSEKYFYPNQYDNPANWQAHFDGTGLEIIEQTAGQITHFVTALGTTGTFMGVTRRLRRDLPAVQCLAVQPATALHGLEGVKHLPTSLQPGIYDPALADGTVWVDTEDAYAMARKVALEEGLLIGVSAAANLVAASGVAQSLSKEHGSGLVVTILCDGGQKYLSEPFWNDRD